VFYVLPETMRIELIYSLIASSVNGFGLISKLIGLWGMIFRGLWQLPRRIFLNLSSWKF
jgi:hypothetical protein